MTRTAVNWCSSRAPAWLATGLSSQFVALVNDE